MMVPRAIGAGLLIFGGFLYGAGLARSMHARVHEIDQVISALKLLETEISFSYTPLPEACERVVQATSGSVRRLFRLIANAFRSCRELRVDELWRKAIVSWTDSSQLQSEEVSVLVALGSTLGRSAADEQVRSLRYTAERLVAIRERLESNLEKQSRLRLYFGIAGGMALAILLV